MNWISSSLVALVVGIGLASLAGCGGQDGPQKYTLEGAVNLASGKPVPAGEISFEPDSGAGNKGPASMTQIKQGKYALPLEHGVVGGKYVVTITPFDGVAFGESLQGKPLSKAPHMEKVEFPSKNSTKDFTVTIK